MNLTTNLVCIDCGKITSGKVKIADIITDVTFKNGQECPKCKSTKTRVVMAYEA